MKQSLTRTSRRGTNIIEASVFASLLIVFVTVVACGTGATEPTPKANSASNKDSSSQDSTNGASNQGASARNASGTNGGRSDNASPMRDASGNSAANGSNGESATPTPPPRDESPEAAAKRKAASLKMASLLSGTRAHLDAVSLGEYSKFLGLALNETRGAHVATNYTAKDKDASELLQWLVKKEYMRYDFAKKLAGGSGLEGTEQMWKSEDPIDNTNACIFTAPNEGATFYRRATSTKQSDGVFMCYNVNWFDRYPDAGMVVLMAGTVKPIIVPFVDFPNLIPDSKETLASPAVGDSSFYGKYPFTGISPK